MTVNLKNWEMYARTVVPITGVSVYLYAASDTHPNPNASLQSTVTNASGMWQFSNLADGNYDVMVDIPAQSAKKWYKGNARAGIAEIYSSTVGIRKNRVINGSMRVAQRPSAGFASSDNIYGIDRGRLLLQAATAATMVQGAASPPVGGSPNYCALTVAAGVNNKFGYWHPIAFADMRDLAGGVVSLQAKLLASANLSDIRIAVAQWAGAADTISADPISDWTQANPALIANWSYANTPASVGATGAFATYKVENIPIASGAVNLAVFVWNNDISNAGGDVLWITDIQLEKGPVCSEFERLPYAQELSLCQLYHEEMGGTGTSELLGQGTLALTSQGNMLLTYQPKRTTPTISLSGGGTEFNLGSAVASTALSSYTVPANGIGRRSCQVNATTTASHTTGQACSLLSNVSTARIAVSAEL